MGASSSFVVVVSEQVVVLKRVADIAEASFETVVAGLLLLPKEVETFVPWDSDSVAVSSYSEEEVGDAVEVAAAADVVVAIIGVEVVDLVVVAAVVEVAHFHLLLQFLRQRWNCDCPSGGEVVVHLTLVVMGVLVVDFAGSSQALVGQPLADKIAVEERLTLERLHQLVDRLRNLADMLHYYCCSCWPKQALK